jgi:two-component system, cell cycle sensor histidine kinase and response regulator CckA
VSDPESMSEHRPETAPPVVFFVDDEEGIRSTWSLVLRKHGYRVVEAGTAEEAIWFIEAFTEPIDVLLMDINLPDGWGASVAQRLREVHPEMSVVYTTGYAESDPILSGALNDAKHVLRKPFSSEQLLRVIAETAGESHRQEG